MMIRDMFADDINRKINGVIKVDQAADDVIEQELNEYVITRELKKHFITFFNYYGDAFDQPTADMGVWISGFFGSGKSHFLKMLSYLLENKEVKGIRSVERFRKKFEDDPATFMLIDRATKGQTETILFNIDIEGFSNKDKTAVLRVFAKMFYNHLGFYGENLKVAMMERYIDQQGKTEEFRRVFEEKKGKSWMEMRRAFAFNGKFIIPTLMEVLDMSEDDAKAWFNDKTATEISIAQLVEDMKAYVDTKPANFRLLFMIDEVGQYVGTDTDMLLNLQSLTEKIGSECEGKIWVICTGQEAIDEIIKVRADEFSRIQARFKTRLSLSSSSVDEVIQKRILKKKPEATTDLETVYEQNDSVLRNLFSFSGSILDIKGYSGPREFTENFPFVPYQFIIMQKVFAEIRKHGNSGKHLSGGERSMLSGFQEAAQKIQEKDEYALVPFFRFYDTVHTFLDGSIRRVIERCQKAADNGDGIEQQDVDVLKLLYLIRYIDDIPSNLDNIVILMADDIRVDKIIMREAVRGCLDRLMSQNYIGRTGDTYNFLTDEEQEVNNEIEKENVETPEIITKVAEMIFEDIFPGKRYTYPVFNGRYAFGFNQFVDDRPYKANQNYDIGLRVLTPWYDGSTEDGTLRMMSGQSREVLVVLPNDAEFLTEIQSYLKIEGFLRKNTSTQLAKYETIKEAKRVEMRERNQNAKLYLTEALKEATIYVNGDVVRVNGKEVVSRINEAIGRLVQTVYHKLSYIDAPMGEAEIRKMLHQSNQLSLGLEGGTESNAHALDDVQGFIAMNTRNHMKTSMKTVKDRFMKAPYGFVEDDVHWLVARLFKRGDLAFTVNGAAVSLNNKSEEEIIGFITKKAFAEKLLMEERVRVSDKDKKAVRDVMKETFRATTSAEDEDAIMKNFQRYAQNTIYEIERLEVHYEQHHYPGKRVLSGGKALMQSVVQIQSALDFFTTVSKKRDDFFDFAEDYEPIKTFFSGEQSTIFARALDMLAIYDDSKTYIVNAELEDIVAQMRSITRQEKPYANIPKLPELRERFMSCYGEILQQESAPVLDSIDQAWKRVLEVLSTKDYNDQKRTAYYEKFQEIRDGATHCNNVSTLRSFADKADALKRRLLDEMADLDYKREIQKAEEEARRQAEEAKQSGNPAPEATVAPAPVKIRKTKNVSIKMMTGTASWRLESKEDIDRYMDSLRKSLEAQLDEDTIVNVEF
mgnify:CR=1 FL=1